MKRIISAALVTAVLAASSLAWADPTPVVTPLNKGQPAPYSGVLLSPEAVAVVITQKDSAAKEIQIALKRQIDIDAAKLKFELGQLASTCTADKTIIQAQLDTQKKQVNILNEQLKKASSSPSPGLWLGLGAGAGVVATVVVVFAVTAASK